ncbi:septum formation initiator family protein [Streptantibioticus rubrisoli]|uniref:septum formation initiator family protein n=1 Tax=Streptantibioticus rubrisoli TaxID=1387313 RepID=UPI0027E28CCD|nr:septum formation initiator family protein [Streptantibioticus rubrisoli]
MTGGKPRPAARPGLGRLLPAASRRSAKAARAPFVLLVVALLASGLISLLLLNTAVNQGSFQLSKLKKETTDLTDQEQALQQEVDRDSAPGTLEQRARGLGMVPGGTPVFLGADGKVHGVPSQAGAPPNAPAPSAGR